MIAERVTTVLDMMRGYLSLAAGLGQVSRRRAMDAARELVEGSPLSSLGVAGPESVAAQVSAVADELMAIGRQNRRLLTQLVRTEIQAVLASTGTGPDEQLRHVTATSRLDEQLRALRERLDELERQLRARTPGESPAGGPATGRVRTAGRAPTRASAGAGTRATTAARTAGTAAPSTGSATTKAATTRAATTRAAAGKAAARKAAARKATARKATATKAAATTAGATTSAARGLGQPTRPARGGARS